jgi:hypothetical protein
MVEMNEVETQEWVDNHIKKIQAGDFVKSKVKGVTGPKDRRPLILWVKNEVFAELESIGVQENMKTTDVGIMILTNFVESTK